jgi:hypothetical protein
VTTLSFDRLLKASRLAMPAIGHADAYIADRSIRISRPDRERLDGKVNMGLAKAGGGSSRALKIGKQLDALTKTKPARIKLTRPKAFLATPMDFDKRQRAVVKLHYFNHAGGGAAGLKAHAKYIASAKAASSAKASHTFVASGFRWFPSGAIAVLHAQHSPLIACGGIDVDDTLFSASRTGRSKAGDPPQAIARDRALGQHHNLRNGTARRVSEALLSHAALPRLGSG